MVSCAYREEPLERTDIIDRAIVTSKVGLQLHKVGFGDLRRKALSDVRSDAILCKEGKDALTMSTFSN